MRVPGASILVAGLPAIAAAGFAMVATATAMGAAPASSIDPGMTADDNAPTELFVLVAAVLTVFFGAVLQSAVFASQLRSEDLPQRRVVPLQALILGFIGALVGSAVGIVGGWVFISEFSPYDLANHRGVPIAWTPIAVAIGACLGATVLAAGITAARAVRAQPPIWAFGWPFPARIGIVAIATVAMASVGFGAFVAVDESTRDTYVYIVAPNRVDVSLYNFSDTSDLETLSPESQQVLAAVNASVSGGARVISTSTEIGENQASSHPVVIPMLHMTSACRANPNCDSPWLHSLGNDDNDKIVIGTAADFPVLIGEAASAQSRNTLREGGAVAFFSSYVAKDKLTLHWKAGKPSETTTISLPATTQIPAHPYYFGLIMTPATAEHNGIVPVETQVIAPFNSTTHRLDTAGLRTRLRALKKVGDVTIETPYVSQFTAVYCGIGGLASLILLLCFATVILCRRPETRRAAPA